jgi:hypothetical protein
VHKRIVGRATAPPSVAPRPVRAAGTAKVGTAKVGTAKVGTAVGKAVPLERSHTELLRPPGSDLPPPVFVDSSGVRRRRLRWLAYLLGVLLVVTLALVWWSQLGGTSRPPAERPCPAASAAAPAGCPR